MEENRLLPMQSGYDEKLFNQLYADTKNLRRKLASEINHNKFGVCYEDIVSWFDIKFIFVFNKHYDLDPDILKGFLINSLRTFKFRMLRSSYQKKYDVENLSIEYTDFDMPIEHEDAPDDKLSEALSYLKNKLSDDAFLILQLELYPPPYITNNLDKLNKSLDSRIPSPMIAEYLDLGNSSNAIKYINDLRREVKENILEARKNHLKIA